MENRPRLVTALASALGCALLFIAFLLGRMTSKTAEAPQAAVSVPAAVAERDAVDPPPVESETPPPNTSSPLGEATSAPANAPLALPGLDRPSLAPPITTAPSSGSSASPERQQIAAYFDQVDRLGEVGGGDPQTFATTLMQSVSSGDFSSFDNLVAQARSQRERLRAIAPPLPCREHHRVAVSLSGDSVAMLERLRAALVKGDTTTLLTISTEGKTLETQANQLKAMGESIKRQAGL